MADIVLRDVEKFFGSVQVIRKVNLTIKDGEFVVLLGPSGCGKTTTLRAIAGLEDITSGEIVIDGKPVQNLHAADRDIAFVFQLYALYPHLSVFENIAFPLRATRQPRSAVERQVRQVAAALGIEHLLARKPGALSGGDMQRVAIGRALVRRPKAILMDEPIGALDAKLREDMRMELKRLHIENKSTSVYVTHDQVEAMALADRIVVMHDGVLQQVGTPSDVYAHPANLFVAQFIGSPVMNIAPAAVKTEGGRVRLALGGGAAAFEMPAELAPRLSATGAGGALSIGVRPEGVQLAREPATGTIDLEAHLIEPLGAYDIVDLKVGEGFLRARTPAGFVARPGDRVHARLDPAQTHFFDQRSGASLGIRLGA
ncbi:ABC transporter ATP-binding protein [Prosthecomicrobium pneumaticum]|uniref:Multiple sugar transport system ATP-binding protein n=1 Tax=Prosthecomicrobium pneumaticum TaxID=81895 RepID=A0A7W9FNU8_9HYPH|nr:ABC transporter ATP-binding protein [Prosthecomicrobium pneumaticum]MBB5754137.1 multiple sugar transport system ATP-binding protein [Prosthecomicrobium pneumaticum]